MVQLVYKLRISVVLSSHIHNIVGRLTLSSDMKILLTSNLTQMWNMVVDIINEISTPRNIPHKFIEEPSS